MSTIESIIAIQTDLMDAIDARDVGRIEQATRDLSRAIEAVRSRGAVVVGEKSRAEVGHALKQTEALRTRVNFMALHNRDRIEKLNQLRGAAVPHTYGNRRNAWGSRLTA